MNDTNPNISQRIKSIRQRHRLTQIEFASRIGTTKPIISAIESGKLRCGDEMLEKICETFDVKRNWLDTGK